MVWGTTQGSFFRSSFLKCFTSFIEHGRNLSFFQVLSVCLLWAFHIRLKSALTEHQWEAPLSISASVFHLRLCSSDWWLRRGPEAVILLLFLLFFSFYLKSLTGSVTRSSADRGFIFKRGTGFGLLSKLVSAQRSAQDHRFDMWCWFNLRLLTRVTDRTPFKIMKIYVMQREVEAHTHKTLWIRGST